MTKPLTGLLYLGGKSTGTGRWVASLLPYKPGYIEPFAGMLGVLLQRKPVAAELINDVSSRVTNWWRVVRDHGVELARRVEFTPVSRDEWNYAMDNVDTHEDPIERARVFTLLLQHGLAHVPNPSPGDFVVRFTHPSFMPQSDKLLRLSDRLRDVQIENIDACRLLEKTVNKSEVVIYCDPPYGDVRGYGSSDGFDRDRFAELLLAQKGVVALSGYANEWDSLGWAKQTRAAKVRMGAYAKSDTHHSPVGDYDLDRVEAVWTNYDVPQDRLFDG